MILDFFGTLLSISKGKGS